MGPDTSSAADEDLRRLLRGESSLAACAQAGQAGDGSQLRAEVFAQTAWEVRHAEVVRDAVDALASAPAAPLLLKGTALAYGLYPAPFLRSRGDTDILVPQHRAAAAHQALVERGFAPQDGISGEFVSYQRNYRRSCSDGTTHVIDLHWKINNSQLLSRLFTHEELWAQSQPLPALGAAARAPSYLHSLLIACMHRATHRVAPYYVDHEAHHDPDRLIWLWDVHLLAGVLSPAERQTLPSAADRKGLLCLVQDSLAAAATAFASTAAADLASTLPADSAPSAVARYLDSPWLKQQWMDVLALPDTRSRLRFLRETLFPDAAYLRGKYGDSASAIGWLHARRTIAGLRSRLIGK